VATIGVCYFIEIFVLPQTQPGFLEMGRAMITPHLGSAAMIYVAIGIIGATVMPHVLYLHPALVQSRKFQKDDESIRNAIRFNALDVTANLSVAFLINAAILVLAAIVFFGKDSITVAGGQVVQFNDSTDWIQAAYLTLAPLMGKAAAGTLFAIACQWAKRHHCRHDGRPGGDGGLHALENPTVVAAAHHPLARHYPYGDLYWHPWGE